jgi:DNA sulfur modification protein DndE
MIYMVGDSTMSDKPLEDNPERGWGMMLPKFFDSTVTVENHAMNGRSTRTFLSENRWQPILDKLKPGDYVIIQFGHNDEKPEKTDRYTPPEDYRKNLIKFVTEARERKAIPVLCTPIVRRRFDNDGKFYDEHGVYPGIVREVAAAYKAPLLDMHKKSLDLLVSLGPDSSKRIFLWIRPGEYKSLPNGREDNTHFSDYGATLMAQIAVSCMKEQKLELATHLRK